MSTTEHISPPVSMTREEAVARAKDFAPVVRERASSAEKERRQPLETIQEITDAGLARLLTPRHWGGMNWAWILMLMQLSRSLKAMQRLAGATHF